MMPPARNLHTYHLRVYSSFPLTNSNIVEERKPLRLAAFVLDTVDLQVKESQR